MPRHRVTLFLFLLFVSLVHQDANGQVSEQVNLRIKRFVESQSGVYLLSRQFEELDGFSIGRFPANTFYGTRLATGKTPLESAKRFCETAEGVFANEVGELVPRKSIGLKWDKQLQRHRFNAIRFDQCIAGVPVFRSGIGFLMRNDDQNTVVISSNNLKEVAGFDATTLRNRQAAVNDTMRANAANVILNSPAANGVGPTTAERIKQGLCRPLPVKTSREALVVWAGADNLPTNPRLAVQFIAKCGDSLSPSFRKHFMVADLESGEILYSENELQADVSGNIAGHGTDGVGALECEPTALFPLPYARVELAGEEPVFTDINGNYTIESTANDGTIRSFLSGKYFDVHDVSLTGGATNQIVELAPIPFIEMEAADGILDVVHNSDIQDLGTANINCYLASNEVRDFVLSVEPEFPHIGTETGFDVFSNIDFFGLTDGCAAFYDGESIYFFEREDEFIQPGCNNTAIKDVIYHEYTHHLIEITQNGQGQFGEGSADTMGVLIEDNPEIGLGFALPFCNTFIRTAENFRSFPCIDVDSPHDCGQILSGCIWDLRNELGGTDPANAREITASLFLSMMIARSQLTPFNETIDPSLTLLILQLDDNDGNIFNGTPHMNEIQDAFGPRNMLPPVSINLPNGIPEFIRPDGEGEFELEVVDLFETMVPDSGQLHVIDENGVEEITPLVENGGNFLGQFNEANCGESYEFFVSFQIVGDNQRYEFPPRSDPWRAFGAFRIDTMLDDSCDTDLGWTVSGDATDGHWERGIPNNGDRGDPDEDSEVYSGLGYCYVTDNGNTDSNDNTDVDNGTTILTSPVLSNVAGSPSDIIQFDVDIWFNDVFINFTGEEEMTIEATNDGGANWVVVETIENGAYVWRSQSIILSDFLAPSANMQVRFVVADTQEPTIVEAGVDAVSIRALRCQEVSVILGDINGDGVVDLLDISPFVDLIVNSEFQVEGDINGDGVVDLLDVEGFVAILTGG